jgi:glycine cleavage system transcriptional repressor
MNELAITVIGPDRPGIVADVAGALAAVGANLTDSTMTRLRGHFTMTLSCTGPNVGEAEAALASLTEDGELVITVRELGREATSTAVGEPYLMTVHGADRLGIVAAVTRVLADADGNITDLSTRLTGPLYLLLAEVELPAGTADAVSARLAEVAQRLDVGVTLRRAESDVL